jgi:hypothetical protein
MAWGLFLQKVYTLSIQLTVVYRLFHPGIGPVCLGPTYEKSPHDGAYELQCLSWQEIILSLNERGNANTAEKRLASSIP